MYANLISFVAALLAGGSVTYTVEMNGYLVVYSAALLVFVVLISPGFIFVFLNVVLSDVFSWIVSGVVDAAYYILLG
jgi:hypothetical protein